MSIQKVSGADLVSFAYECSAVLLSALNREKPVVIKTQILKDQFNGQAFDREFKNNFQDGYNLYLMDRLMLPLFKDVLAEARRREMAATVEMAFGQEGMYAIEVLESASRMSFDEIRNALSAQTVEPQRPQLRLVSGS